MSLFRQTVIVALIAVVAAVAWYAGRGAWTGGDAHEGDGAVAPTRAPMAAPVVVAPVRFQSDATVITAIGTGGALRAVELTPESAGRVVELLFEAGREVEAGAPLLRLDDEDERLALDLARVTLDDARQLLDRFDRMAPSGAVSASEVDSARTALAAAKIEVQQAELALSKRTLRAPISGTTGIPEVDVGDRVGETTMVGTLDDVSALLVDFEVPEAFLHGVRPGGPLTLRTWARRGERFEGEVNAIGSRVDPVSRTVRVRARVANPRGVLKPGMSFSITLPLAGERFPSVPSIAVQWERSGAFVWKIVGGRAERTPVDVLKRSDAWVLVDGALDEGDRVVVEGLQRMAPGRAVEIVDADTVASTGETGRGA